MTESTRILSVAHLGVVEYQAALTLQAVLLSARQTDEICDTLLLLEHPHTYTLGRGADERFLLGERAHEVPVYRVSRGGQVTYHGPGQLIGYPILKLEGQGRDVHRYLRMLEGAIIGALADHEITATRRDGLTGIWVAARKIGSIGVGIKRWTTCHGFAINVCPDLRYFSGIVPCGINGCEMTSIAALGQNELSVDEFAQTLRIRFAEVFGYKESVTTDPSWLWNLVARTSAPVEERHRDA